ncbi:MAG: hypothetical protein ABIP85_04110 [Chthoniobacteraceae bacterium]
MKPHHYTALLTALMLSASPSPAQTPEQKPQPPNAAVARRATDVTIRATIIALPNDEATQFSVMQALRGKPSDALSELEKLVAQKKATSVANLALTTTSGERGVSESGQITLEVNPVASPNEKTMRIDLALNNNGNTIRTSVAAGNGDVKFLGSVLSPTDKTMTEFVFMRVSY